MNAAGGLMSNEAGFGSLQTEEEKKCDSDDIMANDIIGETLTKDAVSDTPSKSGGDLTGAKRALNDAVEEPGPEKARMDQPKRQRRETTVDFSWICCVCNEAEHMSDRDADLLVCEGKCNRPFHYPCAELARLPGDDQTWICDDCQNLRHQCSICQEFGTDDQDVFACSKKDCGLFFHESCLSMQNVETRLTEPLSMDELQHQSAARVPVFTCPAHSCWTCTEDYIPDEEEEEEPRTPVSKKKGGRKKSRSCSFLPKTDPHLFRCLHCPIAFHLSCIPPAVRFHELALLCHEHAGTHKLPDLDLESSLQGQVEAEVEKKLAKLKKQSKGRVLKNHEGILVNPENMNPFFPGAIGTLSPESEEQFREHAAEFLPEHHEISQMTSFCLPCDLKHEVHSKPPSYRHVHSLRYDQANKPKPLTPTKESCDCKAKGHESCGDSCLNRMVMVECIGDKTKSNGEKNPYWNCDMGPSCGNRQMSQRAAAKCKPMREKGKGWGLVSITGIRKGSLVQEYVGEVIDEKTKQHRLEAWSRDHPNDPNYYVMQLDTGWYIDARHEANLSRFVNHSCAPNCRLTRLRVGARMRIGIFSLKDIAPGEFLSYDYQFDTSDGEKFLCRCGAERCRGTMKGGKGAADGDENENKTKKEEWIEAKARLERDRKYLEESVANEHKAASQVSALVPASANDSETVAAGAKRSQDAFGRNGIFLWRTVTLGEDFSSRYLSGRSSKKHNGMKVTKSLPKLDVLKAMRSL